MKKNLIFIAVFAIASLAFASCSSDDALNGNGSTSDIKGNTSLSLGGPTVSEESDTRTSLNGTTINWQSGDKIMAYAYTDDNYTTPNAADQGKTFTTVSAGDPVVAKGDLSNASADKSFLGTYACTANASTKVITFTLPHEQTLITDASTEGYGFCTKNPSWAYWKGTTATFKNICAFLHCSINANSTSNMYNENDYNYETKPIDDATKITKIIVESTDKTPITGTFTCTASTSDGTLSNLTSTTNAATDTMLVVNVPNGKFNDVYIPLPPTATAKKLRVILIGDNATEYNYNFTLTSGKAKSTIFGKGVYYLIKAPKSADGNYYGMTFNKAFYNSTPNANDARIGNTTIVRWVKWSSSTMPTYLDANTLTTAQDYYDTRYPGYYLKLKTVGDATVSEAQLRALRSIKGNNYKYFDFYGAKYVSTTLPDYAFSVDNTATDKCQAIHDLRMFYNVTNTGKGCAETCKWLKKLDLLNTQIVGESGFYFADILTSVRWDKVNQFQAKCFASSHALTTVDFTPCSNVRLGEQAFMASGVVTLKGLDKVTGWISTTSNTDNTNNSQVFYNCTALTEADWSNNTSITMLPVGCFHYCSGMTTIKMPKYLTFMGTNNFNYCWSLTDVYFSTTTPPAVTGQLYTQSGSVWHIHNTGDMKIHVPNSAVTTYTNWTNTHLNLGGATIASVVGY
jgi:hypothetical protein